VNARRGPLPTACVAPSVNVPDRAAAARAQDPASLEGRVLGWFRRLGRCGARPLGSDGPPEVRRGRLEVPWPGSAWFAEP
jgi:hypothetical protein